MDDLVTKANCPGVESLRTTPKFRKRRKFHRRLFTSTIKLELTVTAKDIQRNVGHVQSCCFANLNLLLHESVTVGDSVPSDLKVPNVSGEIRRTDQLP